MHIKYSKPGQRRFLFKTVNPCMLGVYLFLSRKKISNFNSQEEADEFIKQFCKHELGIVDKQFKLCRVVKEHWGLFKRAVDYYRNNS